jgi:RHS repeat-associated protein
LNGTWSTNSYQTTRVFNLGGSVISQNYPSGHSVTYNYDDAGRLGDNGQNLAFTGTLGDGTPRTYSRGIVYAPAGHLKQEQFGTNTAVYNKLVYNSRLQLAEILVSTTGGDTSWNRGKILDQYSLQCSGAGCNATDNNGNLRKQEVYIPADDQVSSSTSWSQQYDYDQLNRLKRVHEYTGNAALDWQQEFDYDRWGNRTINASGTWIGSSSNPPNALLNENQFDTGNLATTNRLYAPGDLALPDNQRRMRYDGAGNLIFDSYTGAGDRVYDAENRMTQAWGGNNQWQYYTYNSAGQRTRRKIDNQETWQVYGFGGELLAEYPASGTPASPQKEYGYRNGQLLITTENSGVGGTPPSNLTATPPSSGSNITLSWSAVSGATNYRVERKPAGGNYTLAGTTSSTTLVDTGTSSGNAYLFRVCVANGSGQCVSSFSNIALGAAITFTDPTIISTVDDPTGVTATLVRAVHITELRTAVNAVRTLAGLPNATWTWTVAAGQPIRVADVRDLRTALAAALTALQIDQTPYIDPTLLGFSEDPINATRIKADHIRQLRQRVTSGTGPAQAGGAVFTINWVITDHLNTPRIVIDLTGSLAGTRRFDYLPFGEELKASNGLRSTTNGYAVSAADGIRQKFTNEERDKETGLDYFGARYYASVQGRFTSVDPAMISARPINPQSWNRYSYVMNRPTNLIDPTGAISEGANRSGCSAESRTCGGGTNTSEDEQEHDRRVQSTRNAIAATEAARNGDWDTYNALMAADSNLVVASGTPPPAAQQGADKVKTSVKKETYHKTADGLEIQLLAKVEGAGTTYQHYNWVQTVETTHPLGGNPANTPYQDTDPGQTTPFYWNPTEQTQHEAMAQASGGVTVFHDVPFRNYHGTTIIWRANLSLVGIKADGTFDRLRSYSYGFTIDAKGVHLGELKRTQ